MNRYLFNLKPIETDSPDVTGVELRLHLWPHQASYSVFLEHQGNTPDQLVQDGDKFDLTNGLLRFYSVPPCHGSVEKLLTKGVPNH